MPEVEFYCVVGKHKVTADGNLVTLANKRKAWKGRCPEHNNILFKFAKSSE